MARHFEWRCPQWILGGMLLGLALVAGCRTSHPLPPTVLRMGVLEDSAPLYFRQGKSHSGLESELGRALAERMGLKPVFVPCKPTELEAALLNGKVDMLMGGITLTEGRRVQMDFSLPYLVVGQAALIRSSDLSRYNTPIKIRAAKARVGVIAESLGEAYATRYFTQASRTIFSTPEAAAAALRENQLDLVLYDAPAAWWLALQHRPYVVLAPALFDRAEVAWAFRRGSVALRESANEALLAWQKDGTLEAIIKRWLPYSK